MQNESGKTINQVLSEELLSDDSDGRAEAYLRRKTIAHNRQTSVDRQGHRVWVIDQDEVDVRILEEKDLCGAQEYDYSRDAGVYDEVIDDDEFHRPILNDSE
ncbi:hypothetical protein E4U25_006453 [Claviceps purpurea]|nr:hypothetical protein E4U25_006453 [Claviceps purpurea]